MAPSGKSRVSPFAPVGPANRFGYGACKTALRWLFVLLHRLRPGTHDVPDGPLILAANHRSFLDPLLLGAVVSRRVTFMMTAKYYDAPLLGWFFRMARCIVVEDGGDNRRPLREALRALGDGRCLGIFPEGHISPDGALQPPEGGLAWLARKSGATVIPMYLGGTREALTKGSARLHVFRKVWTRIGEPMAIADYPVGREGNDAFSRDVMAAIAALGTSPPGA